MSDHAPLVVGIFGASGLVGEELRSLINTRRFPIDRLRLFGSGLAGAAETDRGGPPIEVFDPSSAPPLDLAFLAIPAEAARAATPPLLAGGCTVIDCSSAHRGQSEVPLIVPEINGDRLASGPRLVSSPNCTTTIALMAIEPIRRVAGIRRISMCSYQAVSGAGRRGLDELDRQISEASAGRTPTAAHFPSPILCNLFCHESTEDEFGENEEERKIREESRRILGLPSLAVAATCVRVATRRAHAIAISIETENAVTGPALLEALGTMPGLRVVEGNSRAGDATPPVKLEPLDAEGRDEVLVGRFRADRSGPDGRAWSLFVVGDQVRKGAALNAIQIAEALPRPAADRR